MTSENRLKPARQRSGGQRMRDQPDKPAQKKQVKRKMVMRFRRRLDFTAQERRAEDRLNWQEPEGKDKKLSVPVGIGQERNTQVAQIASPIVTAEDKPSAVFRSSKAKEQPPTNALKQRKLRQKRQRLAFSQQEQAVEKSVQSPVSQAEAGDAPAPSSPERTEKTTQKPSVEFIPPTNPEQPVPSTSGEKPIAKPHRSTRNVRSFLPKAVPEQAAVATVKSVEAAVALDWKEAEQDNSAVTAVEKSEAVAVTAGRLVFRHASGKTGEKLRKEPSRETAGPASEASAQRTAHHSPNQTGQNRTRLRFEKDPKGQVRPKLANKPTNPAQKEQIKRSIRKKQVVDAHHPPSVLEVLLHPSRHKGKNVLGFAVGRKSWMGRIVAIVLLLALLLTSFSACGTIFLMGAQAVAATSWLSADEDIQAADLYYTGLEAELQRRVNTVERSYSDYDEYRYNVDEIGHNPTELISYLSVLQENGIFQYGPELEGTLDGLFAEQYAFDVETFTEERTVTRTVQAGESIGTVVTSAYCNCSICCGQWAGGPTASGVYPTSNHTLAVDAYTPTVPMGTELTFNGTLYKVEDTGNFARYGVDFDVYMDSHEEALAWGHRSFEAYLAGGDGESIEITTTEEVSVCSITLHQKPFAQIVAEHLTEEQAQQYQIYLESRGNRPFLATPVEYDWTACVSGLYGDRCEGTDITTAIGLDVSMPAGTEVYAGLNGTVTAVSGSSVTIQRDKYEVTYGNLSGISVHRGQTVNRGDRIGAVGGAQLHLELLYDGAPCNPYFYFETGNGYPFGFGPEGENPPPGDGSFQAMLAIAEAQLGTPYVWGGSSPGGFDCSGFVCYVLNQSGVRNVGRTTAQGLYDLCSHVSMGDARPGDLIFFTGTYSSGNPVTHVGIYVGNGQMIHAGDPIKYSSIYSSYWQSHFYAMGRP